MLDGHLMDALIGAVAALLAGYLWISWSIRGILRDMMDNTRSLKHLSEGAPDSYLVQLQELRDEVERLPTRWNQIQDEADRIFKRARSAEERARHSVRRTREELEQLGLGDDGLEELAQELRVGNGERGGAEGVPAVHQGMEGHSELDAQAQIAAATRRKFGGA